MFQVLEHWHKKSSGQSRLQEQIIYVILNLIGVILELVQRLCGMNACAKFQNIGINISEYIALAKKAAAILNLISGLSEPFR